MGLTTRPGTLASAPQVGSAVGFRLHFSVSTACLPTTTRNSCLGVVVPAAGWLGAVNSVSESAAISCSAYRPATASLLMAPRCSSSERPKSSMPPNLNMPCSTAACVHILPQSVAIDSFKTLILGVMVTSLVASAILQITVRSRFFWLYFAVIESASTCVSA